MSWKHRSSPGEGFTWRDSRTAGERVVLEVGPPPPPRGLRCQQPWRTPWLTPRDRPLARSAPLSHSGISDPQKETEMTNGYCLRPFLRGRDVREW